MEMPFSDFEKTVETYLDELKMQGHHVFSEYKEFRNQYICNIIYVTQSLETVFLRFDLDRGQKTITKKGLLVTDHLHMIEKRIGDQIL